MIKKYFKILIVVLFTPYLFLSCDLNSAKSKIVEFDTINLTDKYQINGDTSKSYYDINIRFIYPKKINIGNIKDLQNIFVENVLSPDYNSISPEIAVKKYIEDYFKSSNKINIQDNLCEEPFTIYPKYIYDSITYNKDNIISFMVKNIYTSKDSIETEYYKNFVVDLNRNTLINETDIFNPGYESVLKKLFTAFLLDNNNVKSIQELEDIGFFGIDEISSNQNFLINKDGITYIFNQGEYSGYQLGPSKIFIPYNFIKSILKDNTSIYNLAN